MHLQRRRTMGMGCGLALAAWVAAPAMGQVTLFSDDFSDGDRTTNPTWYIYNNTSMLNLSVQDDSADPGDENPLMNHINSGNAMLLDFSSANSTATAHAAFTPVTLGTVGDWIKLSFDMRIAGEPAYAPGESFRFGLWDDAGTSLSADGEGANARDGYGYMAGVDIYPGRAAGGHPDTGNSLLLYQNRAPDVDLLNVNFSDSTGSTTGTDSYTLFDNAQRFWELTIERIAEDDLRLTLFNVYGPSGSTREVTATLSEAGLTPLTYTFGELNIGERIATGNDYLIDNVLVTTNVPEPASLALLALGAGSLALRRRPRV